MTRRVAGALLLATVAACAQAGSPPGGEIDAFPPRVIAVRPEPFSTLQDLSRPVIIRFDERLSERLEGVNELRDAVLVSPETGVVTVDRGRRSLEISMAGGWRPGLVYRVVVLPVFRDLFQNQRIELIDLVFSTGPPISESAVAGFVTDRLTGEPVAGARVRGALRQDGNAYVAVTDTGGFFALRYAPVGDYALRAWADQDRDGEADFFEPADSAEVALAAGDTVVLELGLLPGDTTAARLARAEPIDSVTIRLLFDDYFAPGPVDGRGEVVRVGDSTRVSQGRLLHGSRLDSIQAARAGAADTVADDTAGRAAQPPAAPAAAPGRPRRAAGERGQRGGAGGAGEPRPSRELILLVPEPLTPDSVYSAVVDGVVNIHGIPGGGGSARFQMPPAPAPADAAMPADTAGAVPLPGDGGGAGAPPSHTRGR